MVFALYANKRSVSILRIKIIESHYIVAFLSKNIFYRAQSVRGTRL